MDSQLGAGLEVSRGLDRGLAKLILDRLQTDIQTSMALT